MLRSDAQILDLVRRASERAAALVHLELKKRVDSLASVAVVAPLLGFLGTQLGIASTFRGVSGDKTTTMLFVDKGLSEALIPTTFGLAVGITAWCFYKYLIHRIEALDSEMNNASLELVDALANHVREQE